jgi:GNAT superfamily N-acetyltransferase
MNSLAPGGQAGAVPAEAAAQEGRSMIAVTIRSMRSGEEEKVSQLIAEIFSEHIAPLYSERGRREFGCYTDADAMKERGKHNHLHLVAETGAPSPSVVGMVEIRDYRHVSLLFVDTKYQKQGIGRSLLEKALSACRKQGSGEVTVNSSPNSISAYRRFGFCPSGHEKEVKGIRFVPMKKSLEQ